MKSHTVLLTASAIFLLSACVGNERIVSTAPAAPNAASIQTGALQEVTDDGLEYFDKDMPNRSAHRSAWQLNNKGV